MTYTVSMKLDCRVDVLVDAASFEEAREKAPSADFDWRDVEVIDIEPVNATDPSGTMKDY